MADKYLDTIFEGQQSLLGVATNLNTLANAFHLTGNKHMANKLYDIAEVIQETSTNIGNAVSEDLNERVDQAWETSATIAKAALAGGQLEREKKGG